MPALGSIAYDAALQRKINEARKKGDVEEELYYAQAVGKVAVVPFHPMKGIDSYFKGSWEYEQWVKKNATKLAEMRRSKW